MSLNLGVISAAVTLDDSDYRNRLSKLEQQSEGSFKKIAALAAGYLTFRALYSSGSMAIKTFSDMEEAANRFNAVYGDIKNTANQTMKALRAEFGLSRNSALEMLAGTGDLLTGFGFSQNDALALSERAAKLGADLYSFTNYAGGAKGATEALTKAMLGETEQIKSLGIVIRQDSDEYKNLVKEIRTTQGVTEQQAKALAVLEMATRQSKNAIGDWNRPGETFAQVMQAGKENAREFASIIGGQLQGSVKSLIGTGGDLMKWYNELDSSDQRLISGLTVTAAGLLLLQTNTAKAVNAKAMLAGKYLLTANAAKYEASVVAAAEKQKELASVAADSKKEYQLKKQELLAARSAVADAEATVNAARSEVEMAEVQARSIASAERNAKAHEALTARKLMLDKQEIASASAKAIAIEQANLRVLQIQDEKSRYQYFLKNGTSDGYKSDSTLLQSQKQLNDLTRQYAIAQKEVAVASVNFLKARESAIAASKVDMVSTSQLTTAKKNLIKSENQLSAAQGNTQKAIASYMVAVKSTRTAVLALSAQNKVVTVAQAALNATMTVGGRAGIILSNGLKAASAGLKAFFVSMGPIGWTMIAISGFSAAMNLAGREAEKAIERAKKSSEEAGAAVEKNNARNQSIMTQFKRLETLSNYERLNNSEMKQAQNLLNDLGWAHEKYGVRIDETTKKIIFQKKSLRELMEEEKKKLTQDRIDVLKKQAEAKLEEYNANEKKAEGGYGRAFADVAARNWRQFGGLWIGHLFDSNEEVGKAQSAEQKKLLEDWQTIMAEISKLKNGAITVEMNEEEIAAANEEIRKLQDRIKDKNFDIKLTGVESAAEKLPLLDALIKEIEEEKLQARGDQKKELEAELKLLDLQKERLALIKEQKGEQKEIRQIAYEYKKTLEDRAKTLADRTVDRNLDRLTRNGDQAGVKTLIENEYARALAALNRAKDNYKTAYDEAMKDGYLTDREKLELSRLKEKWQEAVSREDKWSNKLYEQEKKDIGKQQIVVSFSAALLAQNSPQERAVKLAEKGNRILTEIKNNTKPATGKNTNKSSNGVKAT